MVYDHGLGMGSPVQVRTLAGACAQAEGGAAFAFSAMSSRAYVGSTTLNVTDCRRVEPCTSIAAPPSLKLAIWIALRTDLIAAGSKIDRTNTGNRYKRRRIAIPPVNITNVSAIAHIVSAIVTAHATNVSPGIIL